MATDLCEGVLKQILLKKRLKMTKRSNACLNFRSETCKNKVSFSVFFWKNNYVWEGLPDFKESDWWKVRLKTEISHFSSAFEGNTAT